MNILHRHGHRQPWIFGIPDELEIAAIIPIGYRAEHAKILKQKPIPVQGRKHFVKW